MINAFKQLRLTNVPLLFTGGYLNVNSRDLAYTTDITGILTGSYVPYAGAVRDVNLANRNLTNVKLIDQPGSIKMSGAGSLTIQNASILDANPTVAINIWERALTNSSASGTLNWETQYLSGNWSATNLSVGGSPVVTQSQTGQFASDTDIQTLTTSLATTGTNLSGLIMSSGAFLQSEISRISGATGAFLTAATAGGVQTLNITGGLVSGNVILATAGGLTISLSGQTITVSGQNTSNFITTSQTGAFAAAAGTGIFATTTTLLATGGYLQSQINVMSGATGAFITTSMTGQFASDTDIQTVNALIMSSGAFVQSEISRISGATGAFITTSQTGQFARAAGTGIFVTQSQTGTLVSSDDLRFQNIVYTTGAQTIYSQPTSFGSGLKIFDDRISTAYIIPFMGGSTPPEYPRIEVSGAKLARDAVAQTLDWYNAQLFDWNNVISTDWNLRQLKNSSTTTTVDWENRLLTGGAWGIENLVISGYSVQTGAATQTELNTTGAFLQSEIIRISGATGAFVTTSMTGQFASDTDIQVVTALVMSSGAFVQSEISRISGATGAFITTSQTGDFARAAGTGIFATTTTLLASGAYLQSQINVMSGATGAFITTTQTGQFARAAGTGVFITQGQTGQFVLTGESRNVWLTGFTILNDIARMAPDQSGGLSYYYPNVGAFATYSNPLTGALVFNTPIMRTDARRVSFVVQGGDSSVGIDTTSWFRLSSRIDSTKIGNLDAGTGAIASANLIAVGDNVVSKWVGINKSGRLAIAIGTPSYVQDYTRYVVDVWVGDGNPLPVNTGWSWSLETGTNFEFLDLSGLANSAPFASTSGFLASGAYLQSQINVMSGATGAFITTSQTGQFARAAGTGIFATTTTLLATGGYLQSQINVMSGATGAFITTSQTGQFATSAGTGIFATAVALTLTGNRIVVYSGNSQNFVTAIPTGIDITGIMFPTAFAIIPKVQVSLEVSVPGDIMYLVNVMSRSLTGFMALFSDIVRETGLYLHTSATINS